MNKSTPAKPPDHFASTSIQQGIEIAVRHPQTGARLLAQTLAITLNGQEWIDHKAKIQLYINMVRNLIDTTIEKRVKPNDIKRFRRMTIARALPSLKRKGITGLDILVALLAQEIRSSQSLTQDEEFEFYDELFSCFFPEIPLVTSR